MATATKKATEFTVEKFSENGQCVYRAKVRANEFHITNATYDGVVEDEWTVMVQNPSSRAYGTLGSYKAFENLDAVEKAYKGLAGISTFDASLRASALIKRVSGK